MNWDWILSPTSRLSDVRDAEDALIEAIENFLPALTITRLFVNTVTGESVSTAEVMWVVNGKTEHAEFPIVCLTPST